MQIDVLALRTRLGLTVEQFAAELGADPVTIWRWEKSKRRPKGYYRKALKELAKRKPTRGKSNGKR